MKRKLSKGGLLALLALGVACLALGILEVLVVRSGTQGLEAWLSACCPGQGLPNQGVVLYWHVALIEVALVGWVSLGAWNMLVRLARTHTLLRTLLPHEVPLPHELHTLVAELGLQGRTTLIRSSQPMAFCYGYARPRVCLSSRLVQELSRRQLRAVLAHERHHTLHRHPLKTLLLDLIAHSLFFFPVLTELRDVCLAKMELAADHAAVRGVGRKPLAGALHRLLSGNAISEWQSGVALRPLNVTQARIDHLLAGTGARWQPSLEALASTSVSLSLLCLFLMGGVG